MGRDRDAQARPLTGTGGGHMNCPRCGAPLQQGMQFCASCGAQAGATAPPMAPQYPAQQQYPQYTYPPQPYPPQPYPHQYTLQQPYTTPKDGTSTIGKVIIALVVGVIIVVVIGIVLLSMFIGSIDDYNGPGPSSMSLLPPDVQDRQVVNETFWDATTTIGRTSGEYDDIPWSIARCVLTSSEGTIILWPTIPLPDNPSMYDDGSDGSVDIQAWYVDADGDGQIGPGDQLRLTGLTLASEGAVIEVRRTDWRVTSVELPATFT